MTKEPYDYRVIAQQPKLLAFYSGWVGQKVCALAHVAVFLDRSDSWTAASGELDRLLLLLHEAKKAKHLKLAGDLGADLGQLIMHFGDSGWWTSAECSRERAAHHEERVEREQYDDYEKDPGDIPFEPMLALEPDSKYSTASTVMQNLDEMLSLVAGAMDNLDVCRLGVKLSGVCHRVTPQVRVQSIHSILNDLAAKDMIDLEAENEFRRAVSMSQLTADRNPRCLSDPTPMPVPVLSVGAQVTGSNPFDRDFGNLEAYSDLILACVFRRFGIALPPTESDAHLHPDLPALKQTLQAQLIALKAGEAKGGKNNEADGKRPVKDLAAQTEFWSEEAIKYLGLDRLDLSRPDMALQRLIKKGSLHPTKIGGRLVFKKAELDRIREKGDEVKGRGRPRKDAK